jgi:Fur family ferric uptake transcriptional regulator
LQLGGKIAYEHDYGYPQHEHLHCEGCGKVIEFESQAIDELCQDICRQHQFRPNGYNLVIRGICSACEFARSTKRRLDLV